MKAKFTFIIFIATLITSCGNADETDNGNSTNDSTQVENRDTLSEQLTSTFVYGIDISKYQGDEVDFFEFKNDSLTFIICKATEGITYTDPDFSQNWTNITEKGYVGGAYHFYRSNDNPDQQADHFLAAISNVSQDHLPAIVDFEGEGIIGDPSADQVEADLLSFLNTIEKSTGRVPIIYTNHYIGNKYLTSSSFAKYPLWIADYSDADEPTIPSIWENEGWAIWQRTDSYSIGGVSNDLDLFNGSLQEFKAFLK